MSDQCKSCEYKGNLKRCEQADCHYHENWYAKELKARVVELERALTPFAGFACSPIGECDCYNCKARDLLNQPDKG